MTLFDLDSRRFNVSNAARQQAESLRNNVNKFQNLLNKSTGLVIVFAAAATIFTLMSGLTVLDGVFAPWMLIAAIASIVLTYVLYSKVMPYYESKLNYYKNQKI